MSVRKTRAPAHRLLCEDCLVVISRDMVNIKIGEPLEGTPEQQKQLEICMTMKMASERRFNKIKEYETKHLVCYYGV